MSTRRIEPKGEIPQMAFLVPSENSGSQIFEVAEFLAIGRLSNINQVCLADPFVSSQHARIERRPEGFLLQDLKSQNGTFVNGGRIGEVWLCPGDRIRIGEREFLFLTEPPVVKDCPELSSRNHHWHKQLRSLPVFSRTDLPVLLLGASGTGKEIVAHLVHQNSARANGPFVSVNCSALSESLIESELFGHKRGSFTGATSDRAGAFEAARGGTLFLDEVGDLPLSLQPKLLRTLENREIRPLGSDRNVQTDVRIIAATHKNLSAQISKGTFRADLFFRLNVIKVYLPQLRDRMEDFEDLLYGFGREMRVGFQFEAIRALKQHNWPGNIRELRNIVARASALFPGQQVSAEQVRSLLDHINTSVFFDSGSGLTTHPLEPVIPSVKARSYLKEIEKDLIIKRLVYNKGNQRKTALDLGIPKSTLHDRLRTYQINIDSLLREGALD